MTMPSTPDPIVGVVVTPSGAVQIPASIQELGEEAVADYAAAALLRQKEA